ncbi:hypothetical protein [Pelagibacterium luteolum]|uniref:ParE toxin of type II toxin-antitoxin system, parDE n=1 Tax=Pelagibacterium luteolum TaxID=440168 RepID=A0A1G7X5Q0_9HYPH|nr:hypothetical protein [Pelagibacterium luteolum]SDG79522.1 hypothetical protein SAMN04487974_108126 [Pelagibacterium luteolum]
MMMTLEMPETLKMRVDGQARELVFGEIPYIVAYRVTEVVEILAVMHTARKRPDE